MLAAARGGVTAWVGLGPSRPARERDPAFAVGSGTFGAEEYGIVSADLADQPTMPDLDLEERRIALASLGRESRRARDERRAGIVVAGLSCPALVVAGGCDAIMPPSAYDDFRFRPTSPSPTGPRTGASSSRAAPWQRSFRRCVPG